MNDSKKNDKLDLKLLSSIPLLKSADSSTVKQFKSNYSANEKEVTTAKVYRVKQVDAKAKAHDLANEFNIKIKNEIKDDNIYSVSSEQGSILVSTNGGGFTFYNNSSNKNIGVVPTSDECVNLAVKFLKDVKLYDNSLKAYRTSENYVEYQDSKKEIESRDVYFNFRIDNIEVSSGNIIVQIGKEGNILSVVYNKKELELIGDYPIVSKEEAINQANSGKAIYSADKNLGEVAYVNNISIVYLDNGPFSEQYTEYHPIYLLEGSVDTPTSKDKFLAQVRAIKPEYVKNSTIEKNEDKGLSFKNSELNEYSEIFLNDIKIDNKVSIKSILNDVLSKNELTIVSYGNADEVAIKMNDQINSTKFIDIRYLDKKSKFIVTKEGKKPNLKTANFDIERIVIPLDKSMNKIYFYSKDRAVIVKPNSGDYITNLIEELK